MKFVSRYRGKLVMLGLLIAAVLLLTYAPLARAHYGFGDDFILLLSDEPLEYAYMKDGRPLFALAQLLVHRPIQGLHQFGYLRFTSSLSITAIALFFFWQVRRLGGSKIEHAALAIAVGTLPCLHTYVAQANFWLAPLAGLLVLWAAVLTFRATEFVQIPHQLVSLRLLPAMLLMLIAAAAYQPMLSWYWTMVLIYLLDRRYLSSAAYRKRVYYAIAVGLAFFVICFIAFKLYFVLFGSNAKPRTQLTSHPLEKLYWFSRIQLPLALNFWHLMDSSKRMLTLGIAAISLCLMLSGYIISCLRYHNRLRRPDWGVARPERGLLAGRTVLIVLVLLLTHVHWLAIGISPQSYRIIASLGVAVLLWTYWSLRQLSVLIPGARFRVRCRQVFLVLVAAATVFSCQHYSEKYWIAPHSAAYQYMLMTIREGMRGDIKRVHLVRQGPQDGFVSEWFIESFGRPATERPWTIEAMVQSALHDSGVDQRVETITHGAGSEPIPSDSGTLVIDMRKMVLLRLAASTDRSTKTSSD